MRTHAIDPQYPDTAATLPQFQAPSIRLLTLMPMYVKLGSNSPLAQVVHHMQLYETPPPHYHLHHAIIERNHISLGALVSSPRTEINRRGLCGETALHWAAALGDVKAIKKLWMAGADATAMDSDGRIPLDVAELAGNIKAAEYLRDYNTAQTQMTMEERQARLNRRSQSRGGQPK